MAYSLGNEVRRWKTLWQLTDKELPNNQQKKAYYTFGSPHSFLEIMPKLCYFLKIMLSVTEIMLLRFYTDFKENKDHQ